MNFYHKESKSKIKKFFLGGGGLVGGGGGWSKWGFLTMNPNLK